MLKLSDFEVVHDERSKRVAAAVRPQPTINHIDMALKIARTTIDGPPRHRERLLERKFENWLDHQILVARADPDSHWPGRDPEPPLAKLPTFRELWALSCRDADNPKLRKLRAQQVAALMVLTADRSDESIAANFDGRSWTVHTLAVLYAINPERYASARAKLQGRVLFQEVGAKPRPTAAPTPVRTVPTPTGSANLDLYARFAAAGDDAKRVARNRHELGEAISWLNRVWRHTPEGKASAQARADALAARWRTEHPGEPLPSCPFGRIHRPLAGLLTDDAPQIAPPAPTPSDPGNFDPLSLLPAHLRPGTADPNDDTPGLIPVDLG